MSGLVGEAEAEGFQKVCVSRIERCLDELYSSVDGGDARALGSNLPRIHHPAFSTFVLIFLLPLDRS
ncbi:unnamed protein product [Caenorhabditis auriculariae]|uniref:Uncharacterized protein n=1 Tax=Caenorhabditis auriculariae TaxID=2777116 RepID=A0A8S1HQB7_9PELO|nr:unnamed protein product [Caenorhabditis auriculariae]